ncbi:response regulator [Azospirillum sp. TSO22-1]|uniref:response regulator n=1 Tax=Azospirillum sp. TSO22-1 TaxID=716789 RepID=UPI000D6101A7|nr:response regulator [Azospirillum sp. TSO22-1]PWC41918.1 hypothetical protein TSO221_22625 [Azospirillum sp. TSO22-1]
MAHILIIKDDDLHREMLESALERTGNQVTTVSDGEEGLARRRTEKVDLVLTDLFMPHTDGIELIRKMSADDTPVPVIAMTGGVNGGHRPFTRDATLLGARAVLTKPFSIAELLAAVEGVLKAVPFQNGTDTPFV